MNYLLVHQIITDVDVMTWENIFIFFRFLFRTGEITQQNVRISDF